MREIIFSKYSNERDRRFAIRTDILEEDGRRWLEKTSLYPEGKGHIENMLQWNQKLDALYRAVPFVSNKCEAGEDCVKLEYLEEENLAEYLDDLLEKGKEKEAEQKLTEYLENVRKIHSQKPFSMTEAFERVFGKVTLPENLTCAEITNIDMICDNVLLTSPYTILDYEWTFDFPVPCEFVLYRIIHYYIQTHSVRRALDEETLYGKFGITEEARERNVCRYDTRSSVCVPDKCRRLAGIFRRKERLLSGEKFRKALYDRRKCQMYPGTAREMPVYPVGSGRCSLFGTP